jgi:hypothetical protein
MSYIFNHVKIALQNINKPDVKTLSRMGSFENFCRKIRGETEGIFKKLICDQQEFSEDMFTEIFHSYCRGQTIETVIKTAQEIAEEMQELCHRRHLKMVITSHAVGYKLKRKYEFVDVEKQILSQRKVQYLLQIKCELKPVEKKTGWMD